MSRTVRILIISLGALFLGKGILHAQQSNLLKGNAISLKGGYHFYESSDFTKFWGINPSDYGSFAGELAYERKITKYISIEIPFGYYYAKKSYPYNNIVSSGDGGAVDLSITNLYISPSLKLNIPITNSFQFYLGGGPDFNYVIEKVSANYQSSTASGSYARDDNFQSIGFHGLAGAEYFSASDFPLGLFLEYKYSYVNVKDFDRLLIKEINSTANASLQNHDFNAGGHLIFLGVRWHF